MLGLMIFKPAARYPVDPRVVFILAFSVFTGLTALVLDQGPQSLESQMPKWGVVVWGAVLMTGSIIALWGVARQTLNGILTEQVGSIMVGSATIFYSVVATMVVGWGAVQTVGIVFAWGLACILRWFQLQTLILTAYHSGERIHEVEVLRDNVKDGFNAEDQD
jgi:hypothetical protein